jgi:hypothetical protein
LRARHGFSRRARGRAVPADGRSLNIRLDAGDPVEVELPVVADLAAADEAVVVECSMLLVALAAPARPKYEAPLGASYTSDPVVLMLLSPPLKV